MRGKLSTRYRLGRLRVAAIIIGFGFILLLLWVSSDRYAREFVPEAPPAPPLLDTFSKRTIQHSEYAGLRAVFAATKPAAPDAITITTHFTIDRLPAFKAICEQWRGPISAAILIRDEAEHQQVAQLVRESIPVSEHADIHYLLAAGRTGYPVNHLRNLAIQQMVRPTQWLFPLDVDFVPGAGFPSDIQPRWNAHDATMADLQATVKSVTARSTSEISRPKVFVVPGFECLSCKAGQFPQTKPHLLAAQRKRVVQPVLATGFFLAHENVNYTVWEESSQSYQIEYDFFFEPYYVGRTESYVPYNENFSFYGHDKASHTYELAARGWEMWVLPYSFAVHAQHSDNWSAKPDRPAVYQHIVAHMRQMAEQYGFWPRLPSQKWFYFMFSDGDKEQAEFKKELVRLLWQWVAGRAKSEVLGPDLMAARAASLT